MEVAVTIGNALNDFDRVVAALGKHAALLSGHDSADMPVKKMIASALIDRVTVHSDYQLDIQFNITYEQFVGLADK